MYWLYEERVFKLCNFCFKYFLRFLPIRFREPQKRHHRQIFREEYLLSERLVHCDGGGGHIAPDKRHPRHAQESHKRAVLAVRSVHCGKDNIYFYFFISQTRPDQL